MDTFCEKISLILKDEASEQLSKALYNIFIIGYQESGKSTLANVLSDQQNLYFEKEGTQYRPINQHYFPITQEDGLGTSKSNSIIIQDYQIWDFPGYGTGENSTENIQIRIKQIAMMNKASGTHIIIVFPYTQFTQDRGQNIIQLMNLIAQKDLPASIIISKVPPKQKLQNLVDKLQTQLGQEEVIYSDEAKEILDQIIKNKRIQLLYYPQQVEDNQQFKKESIDLIKELVFDKKNFIKVKLEYRFLPSQQLIINDYMQQLKNKLNEIGNQIIKETVQNNINIITRNISDQELYKNENDYLELLKQKDKYIGYQQIFQQITNQCQDTDIYTQIRKINEFFTNKDVRIIQNQLYINCASITLSELKSIYNSNRNIQEIYIQSHCQFVVECDIEMPGVHVFIKCTYFSVVKQSLINLKGQPGQSISEQARSGDEKNIHGDVGQDGNQGEAGGIFYVDAQKYFSIEKLIIDISGGDGGNGQDGGDGLNGNDGENGKAEEVEQRLKECEVEVQQQQYHIVDIFHYYYLSSGKPGGIGGDSGCGGIGGQSGAKGVVHFHYLQAINQIIIDNSKIGLNGKNGKPGSGGQNGLDYVGLYQDFKSKASQAYKKGAKDFVSYMSDQEIIEYISIPAVAMVSFGLELCTTVQQFNMAVREKGWKKKQFNEENKNWAPSGSVISQNTMKQQQITLDADINYQYKIELEKFQNIQDQWKKVIVYQFKELQLGEQEINYILNGVNK
ncbi:hypothetical protein pb186bvf_019749 [Paramecium bursaria]